MPASARLPDDSLLAALRARRDVWRGGEAAVAPGLTFATGFPVLDAELPGGGWPRGALTELMPVAWGIGELSLLTPALAGATAAGGRVVLVAPPGRAWAPHGPAWAAAGLALAGLCGIFPATARDALWAAVQALRCRGVGATLLWLDASAPLSANSLRRLQVAAGEGGGLAFLFRPETVAVQASPAPLRLRLAPAAGRLRIDLLKRRGAPARGPVFLSLSRPARFPLVDHVVPSPLVRPLLAAGRAVLADA